MNFKKSPRILAVDDLPDNLELIEAILDGQGYQVQCMNEGATALAQIKAAPPDLILLDVMMPNLDGYEMTRRIRQDATLPYIPILLITADDQSNVVKGLDAGADDFIRKPVDIDELLARVRSLLRLKCSIDEQRAILQQRDDFVARLTHDLRTPLVAANRMLQFCREGAFGSLPLDLEDVLTNMQQNNTNLLEMANTLLEVYRHEAGQKEITPVKLDLNELIRTVVEELSGLAQAKGLYLRIAPPQPLPGARHDWFETSGDRLEIRRVLTNVIGNAIKFTDTGGITVGLQQLDRADPNPSTSLAFHASTSMPSQTGSGQQWLQISVSDTGAGIEPEDQQSIFEWFRPGKHRSSSSGLGLHLSRRIAEMHGGTLTVTSQPGEGSTFYLRLPKATVNLDTALDEVTPFLRESAGVRRR